MTPYNMKVHVDSTLLEFDPKTIKAGNIVLIIGKRNTGKSFLIRDLMYYQRQIPCGFVIAPTSDVNDFFHLMLPKKYIRQQYDDSLLQKLFARQQQAINEKWENPEAFLIMDDCMSYSKRWDKIEEIRKMFCNGRWYKILMIMTSQEVMGFPPLLRQNADYVFISKNNNQNLRKNLYQHYASVFPHQSAFNIAMDEYTENYGYIVINNMSTKNDLQSQAFWYRAKKREPYKLLGDAFWAFQDKLPNEERMYQTPHGRVTIRRPDAKQ